MSCSLVNDQSFHKRTWKSVHCNLAAILITLRRFLQDLGYQINNTRNVFDGSHQFKQFAKEWGFRHTIYKFSQYVPSNIMLQQREQSKQQNASWKRQIQIVKIHLRVFSIPKDTLFRPRNITGTATNWQAYSTNNVTPTHRWHLTPQTVEPKQVVTTFQQQQNKTKEHYDKWSRDLSKAEDETGFFQFSFTVKLC